MYWSMFLTQEPFTTNKNLQILTDRDESKPQMSEVKMENRHMCLFNEQKRTGLQRLTQTLENSSTELISEYLADIMWKLGLAITCGLSCRKVVCLVGWLVGCSNSMPIFEVKVSLFYQKLSGLIWRICQTVSQLIMNNLMWKLDTNNLHSCYIVSSIPN